MHLQLFSLARQEENRKKDRPHLRFVLAFPYLCCARLALVRPSKDVERPVSHRALALVDVHATEIDVNSARAPGTKIKNE